MVKALLLDKKNQNQSPAPVKAVEESCVTCGGAHSYRNCPATDGNVYRDNIQEFISQTFAVNYNQGNTSYRPSMMSNQIRPLGFPPAPAYQALAPQTQGVLKEDFLAYVKANDVVMRNMQTQGQNMQNQLTNLTDLITRFVNSNSASTSSSGTLSSNTITNPRSDLKAITTRSVNPTNNRSTEDVQPQVVQSESPVLTSKPVASPISKPAIAPLREMARTLLNEHCSAVLLKKLPEKLGDPGKFMIPCDFPGMAECLALADLGASINLMLFLFGILSLPDVTPTCMTLELADRSISHPVGVAEDVYVMVGSFHFSADFVVVDLDADPRVPLILGGSFLKTRRALIDVFEANYSDMTAKRIDVIDMACEEYSQEVLSFSDTISSGNPTPFYDPIPYLDPEGDILLLEAFLNDDPSLAPPNQGNYLPEVRKELKIYEAKYDKSSIGEPIEVELKDLPPHLKYAFLKGDDKLPVIIAKDLSVEEKTALITVLKSHKRAIAWKLFDIKERMLKRCEDTNLCLNWEKSHFMVKEGIVLGHKIFKQGIEDMPFEVMYDASDFAIGAVLGQRQDKHFRPIYYASKTMTEAESNYTITKKEMLAVVYAFEKFWSYLIMNKSIVYTDHSALKYLFAKKRFKGEISPMGFTPPGIHLQSD
nr:hypothetical protein [Tanacetum cinerariifolium]